MELELYPKNGMTCWPSIRKSAPCESGCPAKVNIPGFVISVSRGEMEEANAIMRQNNPFAGVCGYVCHHPCENECTRARLDEAVSVRSLHRFVIDHALTQEKKKIASPVAGREKVAIVGSGPCGLTAAHDLAKLGYSVTVFEAMSVAGGMLVAGIPEFVLPREITQAEVGYIEDLGIEIKTGVRIGQDLSFDDLMAQGFKAVFLAVGAQQSLGLNIPGIDSKNVLGGLEFLRDVNLGNKASVGSKVVVIGGGNVAIDVARAALRLGAREVHLACLESREQMPAFAWEIENAELEGVKIHCAMAPQEVTNKDGTVSGINFADVASLEIDPQGRLSFEIVKGSKHSMEADCIITAIGQGVERACVEGFSGLEINERACILVDSDTLATSLPGVFAGGDVLTGRGTVVEAVAAGQKAALGIDNYLRRRETVPMTDDMGRIEVADEQLPGFVPQKKRCQMPSLPVKERLASFKPVELGFDKESATNEAKRCLSCPVCGNCIFYRSQLCYETATRLS